MAQNCGSEIDRRVTRVLLVESMSLLRDALAAVLSAEDDLDVVAGLDSFDRVAAVAQALDPDVAVLDVKPPMAGAPPEDLTAVLRLSQQLPACAILLMTSQEHANRLHRMLAAMAPEAPIRGIIDKDNTPSQLIGYIRQAAQGKRVLDPRLTGVLCPVRNPLTMREREILRWTASGLPAVEVAAKLGLSPGTVRTYLSAIIRKTGARNRLEAVRIATQAGWL
jgi:two-component system response regulator DesR